MHQCKYFKIYELVSRAVYQKFNTQAWQFFDKEVLADLDTIRETWGSPLIINNWHSGGQYNESGLRSNMDSILKNKTALYLSAHVLAKGFDIKDQQGKNKALHAHICSLISQNKLKRFRRVESIAATPTWVHVDAFQTNSNKITIFS